MNTLWVSACSARVSAESCLGPGAFQICKAPGTVPRPSESSWHPASSGRLRCFADLHGKVVKTVGTRVWEVVQPYPFQEEQGTMGGYPFLTSEWLYDTVISFQSWDLTKEDTFRQV